MNVPRHVVRASPNRYNTSMSADQSNMFPAAGKRHFATTQWNVVLAAGNIERRESRIALAQLCETYWCPLYAYVRRRVDNVHEAQDLTQAFFSHLLEKQVLAQADRSRGRFRAFLVTALKNFHANERKKARTEKRGGGDPRDHPCRSQAGGVSDAKAVSPALPRGSRPEPWPARRRWMMRSGGSWRFWAGSGKKACYRVRATLY